jgi:hypothetical protein
MIDYHKREYFTTRSDLERYLGEAMGESSTPASVEIVADYLCTLDHPRWGANWWHWLEPFDFWEIERTGEAPPDVLRSAADALGEGQ